MLNRTYCLNTCEWEMFEWGTTHLRLNSKHKRSDNKPQILSGNASAESVVAEVATLDHLYLKVHSASIAAFRILLAILPHFAWVSSKNFLFFIFQRFTWQFEFYNLKSYSILTYSRLAESNSATEPLNKYFIVLLRV